ncbi:MAG TPA: CpsB/CapC family capsule biosynthesis tyrosine phosphatase [Bryobacteraceae bacterium]|nr:CpsB/CapC family capsule biosynthesis tyrosine phosphatase [Bryobacteraceae bacterium]
MIDIHSHILPGLDDGARDLEQALEMLKMAAAAGTTDIVATSHSNLTFEFDPAEVEQLLGELQRAAGDLIRIHYGCELHMTLDGIENALRNPEQYSIAHRGHLLVEFSDFLIPKSTTGILDKMLDRGLRPVIAHPERNPMLRTRISELEEWASRGCSMQVTAQSLLGRFGKSARAASHQLMAHGLVHFLASDAHDLEHRPPVLNGVEQYVRETFEPEVADCLLVENPGLVLEGLPVSSAPFAKRKRPWYALW